MDNEVPRSARQNWLLMNALMFVTDPNGIGMKPGGVLKQLLQVDCFCFMRYDFWEQSGGKFHANFLLTANWLFI